MASNTTTKVSTFLKSTLNFIRTNIAPILFIISIISLFSIYLNAFANHRELYKYMNNRSDNPQAYTWYNLVPNQCSSSGIVLAAQFPSLSKFLGYVNPYTPIYADIAARSGKNGVTFETLTQFIYQAETTPNIVLDNPDVDPTKQGLFQKVFGFNPTESYTPNIPPPKPSGGDNFLAYLNTGIGALALLAMVI